MVIILKKDISNGQKENLTAFLHSHDFKLNEVKGEEETVIAAVGRVKLDVSEVELIPGVQRVIPISRPYKMASREFKKENTVVEIKNSKGQIIRIGGNRIVAAAGPCTVESREQIMSVAASVAESGAVLLRSAAFRPQSSPYTFEGLGEEGLKYLKEAGEKYGLPVVTEIGSENLIPMMQDYGVDVYQIGAGNMQNFDLLKKVGALGKPVILKRSYTATLEELLMSAEYLLSAGTENVILCERGIRTFEHSTRNTLDLSAVQVLRSLTHLPVIVDPSHAVGIREKIPAMALAAVASGADGVVVDVHPNPEKALSGAILSIVPEQFDKMMHDIEALAPVMGKSVYHIFSGEFAKSERKSDSKKLLVAYSGKKGAYAEQAIGRYFDASEAEAVALDSFSDVFQSVADGSCDYGMIPIENSLNGSVYQNYDNFSRFEDVEIAGSVTLNIRHSLLGLKSASLSDIKTVYSHPQGFGQSKKYLDQHKDWALVDSVSTSTAAEFVASHASKSNAAIGSIVNAEIYGLKILAEDIEDDPGNFTRFVVIASRDRINKSENKPLFNIKPNMASFIFTTKNESGALYNTLGIFEKRRLNLTRLESRPIKGQLWKSWFYADVEINKEDGDVYAQCASIYEELKDKTEEVRLLGVYADGR
ncbi:3-deoxy-7-phosphoheptulonate synthase [Treponema sp.]|uniref:3-deoxy-7-phosphoheptulonate synthase n=1 Tax=Treponema sp. TaxID=166 RepID=UPI00257F500D|nr:3-deoxy-7-phosphoheptulonate synthase [Treponema sp.]MBE6353610.1 3-deoxy-7-phosphoheptulonate synthase [Treponema sp.]